MAWSGLQLAVHYIEGNNQLQPTTTHNYTIYNIKQYCVLFQSDANIYASN